MFRVSIRHDGVRGYRNYGIGALGVILTPGSTAEFDDPDLAEALRKDHGLDVIEVAGVVATPNEGAKKRGRPPKSLPALANVAPSTGEPQGD